MPFFIISLHRSVVRAFAFKLTGPEFNPQLRQRVNFFRQITFFSVFFTHSSSLLCHSECVHGEKVGINEYFVGYMTLIGCLMFIMGRSWAPTTLKKSTCPTCRKKCVSEGSHQYLRSIRGVKKFDFRWEAIIYVVHLNFRLSVFLQRLVMGSKMD